MRLPVTFVWKLWAAYPQPGISHTQEGRTQLARFARGTKEYEMGEHSSSAYLASPIPILASSYFSNSGGNTLFCLLLPSFNALNSTTPGVVVSSSMPVALPSLGRLRSGHARSFRSTFRVSYRYSHATERMSLAYKPLPMSGHKASFFFNTSENPLRHTSSIHVTRAYTHIFANGRYAHMFTDAGTTLV